MRGLVVVACLAFGCDSRATASDPQGGGARAEQKSRELESCGASVHCQDDLRCFEQQCRRTKRSNVGDYYAAVGAAARARGEHDAAVAAYKEALKFYDTESVALPPDVDCAYGAALAAAKDNKEHAELAARVLHRCMLAVPIGSELRAQAIVQLATLSDTGLDPQLLAGTKIADNYLTKGPTRPATDKLAITVSATPQTSSKTFAQVPDKITGGDARPPLIACWEAYNATTKRPVVQVTIGVKAGYAADPNFPDEGGAYVMKVDSQSGGMSTAEGVAERCVRQVVEPLVKGIKPADSFSTKMTVTIK